MRDRYLYLFLLMVLSTQSAQASELVRVARYSTIAPVATRAQAKPLQVVVQIRFPHHITTLGEAFAHLLIRSGYRMANAENADPNLGTLLHAPLPEVHRRIGPITLERALRTLAGPAWTLVVDPVHRLVSFELVQHYRTPAHPKLPPAASACTPTPPRSAKKTG